MCTKLIESAPFFIWKGALSRLKMDRKKNTFFDKSSFFLSQERSTAIELTCVFWSRCRCLWLWFSCRRSLLPVSSCMTRILRNRDLAGKYKFMCADDVATIPFVTLRQRNCLAVGFAVTEFRKWAKQFRQWILLGSRSGTRRSWNTISGSYSNIG